MSLDDLDEATKKAHDAFFAKVAPLANSLATGGAATIEAPVSITLIINGQPVNYRRVD